MPFKQEQCRVEQMETPAPNVLQGLILAVPAQSLISVNSREPILSLEYHGKHTHLLEVNTFMDPFQTWDILWIVTLLY